ncbi:hypothetical protein NIIDNTM18_25620 [Mycolicibacterium litorale]|uniref:DUF1214 domain-containing protein n=1 Tax=Mycolicibacterium litorale TaxID=758802 RepID=A0A6S6P3K0_9MYCO|nr:DUF1214 domain-containing protein [Mycolicibacterium litorale]BCI53284.1 hypothetical protein NIIDNTM18_25620 [Mycolicibacterium litorale]
MTPPHTELSTAFGELLDELRHIEDTLLRADPPLAEPDLLDGYRLTFSLLRVAVDAYVWGDKDNPRFVDVIGPYLKWGGDNSDAFYQIAPIDPRRTYRVRGNRGDAVYLSITVYGGPDDGRYSTRIVGTLNDRDLDFDDDGNFAFTMSATPQSGAWLRLDDDAVTALTRDYLTAPQTGRRTQWTIEAIDPPARRHDDAEDLARRMRAARTWIHEQVSFLPTRVEPPNEIHEPFPVPQNAYGWSAADAAYAMGAYDLRPDQALVVEGTSPECAFWNLCLWNPFLHTYDYTYERVTLNGAQIAYEPDGSWRIVIADRDPGHPNWVSTAGRRTGLIWLRWFLPEETPARPRCRVVDLAEVTR